MTKSETTVLLLSGDILSNPERLEGFLAQLELLIRLQSTVQFRFAASSSEVRTFLAVASLEDTFRLCWSLKALAPRFNHWVMERCRKHLLRRLDSNPQQSYPVIASCVASRTSTIWQPEGDMDRLDPDLQLLLAVPKLFDTIETQLESQRLNNIIAEIDKCGRPDLVFTYLRIVGMIHLEHNMHQLSTETLFYMLEHRFGADYTHNALRLFEVVSHRENIDRPRLARALLRYVAQVHDQHAGCGVRPLVSKSIEFVLNKFTFSEINDPTRQTDI